MARKAHPASAVPAVEADTFERDIWLYREPNEARIFRAGEPVPAKSEGWRDHPGKAEAE